MNDPKKMAHVLAAQSDAAWMLDDDGFDPLRESSRESRFSISNGFLGIRGARVINRGTTSHLTPRTYVAGLFDCLGVEQPVPSLVPAADWLQVRISLSGGPMDQPALDMSSHHRALDMSRGVLLTGCCLTNPAFVGVQLSTLRLASLSERSVGLQLIQITVEKGEVEVTLEASFEGLSFGLAAERLEPDLGVWRTKYFGKRLAMATQASLKVDGRDLCPTVLGQFRWSWSWTARPGQVVSFERLVAVTRGDTDTCDPARSARGKLETAGQRGWCGIVADHEAAWKSRWHSSDVEVDGDQPAQKALRFAAYHLNSAANPADERVSIAARALTGDDYRGHVFWDTEIFLIPFYSLTWPEAARALLMYRFHTLDAARAKAARLGWRGAFYAWESASDGAEVTPEQAIGPDRLVVDILCGKQEQHISADVAYAVWQYWLASGDEAFLRDAGAEILLETGRFWSSRAQSGTDGRGHIRGVIGPDEYHEHIDDNAFTNVMARWNIRRALDVAALLQTRWPDCWTRISVHLHLEFTELEMWRRVADTMATGLDRKTGLFEQFEGFSGLEEIDLAAYACRSVPMDVVLGRERIAKSQVIKQADVVALLALLPDEFASGTGEQNFEHYEPRCSHGSSLSRVMHGLAAARLGQSDLALSFLHQTAAIDLADTHVAIDGGVHIAALGGIWMIAIFGFAGLSIQSDGIAIDPQLPTGWRSLAFGAQWHGRRLKLRIDGVHEVLEAILEAGEPMTLTVEDEPHDIRCDRPLRVSLRRLRRAPYVASKSKRQVGQP
jgi:trehalose/maltose hydrolase-like predicted phosphorylase